MARGLDTDRRCTLGKPDPTRRDAVSALALWKRIVFPVVPTIIVLVLTESVLALLGVTPRLHEEDPFVGFASQVPLYVESTNDAGQVVMTTSSNKRTLFNAQTFLRDKPAGTTRIFCLGGSTTYGRPYYDATAFSGWLRALLPVADPGKHWEVINAGGISYASYRVATVMEELTRYDPDVFIVYTGHNEFLEERTYGTLRDTPGLVKASLTALSRTRIGSVLSDLATRIHARPHSRQSQRTLLPSEVSAKLDHSAGPALYTRDRKLQTQVTLHFRDTLERMHRRANAAGATLVLVEPASNLKDCSPFKSEHTEGLDPRSRAESEALSEAARGEMDRANWTGALESIDRALQQDPDDAALHYRRGRCLWELDRIDEAEAAFRRALDEDICPLRAITAIRQAVREVAHTENIPLVDFPGILGRRMTAETGRRIVGSEYFLDHVHPTIAGHRILAVALIETMRDNGLLRIGPSWTEASVAEIAERVESELPPEVRARALANLALTLDWAGKHDESQRLADDALASGIEDASVLLIAARHAANAGNPDRAVRLFRRAVRASPGDPVVHAQFGLLLAGLDSLEAAAAHLFLASLLWENNADYHRQLGFVMSRRGRPRTALASYRRARDLEPDDPAIAERIATLSARLPGEPPPEALGFAVTRHPSGYPETIAQTKSTPSEGKIICGIWTKWFDGGGLEAFADYRDDEPCGVSIRWDRDGNVSERTEAR